MRHALLLALLLLAGCRSADGPMSATTVPQRLPAMVAGDTGRIGWSVPNRAGALSDSAMVALLPRVARLVPDLDTIAMGIGDSVFLPHVVRILAVDAAGTVLGELRRYDFSMNGGLFPLRSGALRSARLGAATFTATWPQRRLPAGHVGPPAAVLTVLVTEVAGVVVPPPRPGTARVTGTVLPTDGSAVSRGAVATAQRGAHVIARVPIDERGEYRLDGLPAGVVRLSFFMPGRNLESKDVLLTAGHALTLDVRLLPATSLPIRQNP